MGRRKGKGKKVVRGMPSAVILSIVIHAALFLLAGMLVVFTVAKHKEVEFAPPKAVERPKMKLKKPRVKVKKSAKPKPTTRIVTKVQKASMPDIRLPEMSSMGDGIDGGLGGFEIMPNLDEVSVFGSGQSIGNDLVGTFYDFKRANGGRNIPHSEDKVVQDLKEFVRSGWKPSELARYYRSPKKLYATTVAVPTCSSSVAPWAFGEHDTIGYLWMIHYKGQLVHKQGITFRFWGYGDDIMVVAVDGKTVLSTGWSDFAFRITPHWQTSSAKSDQYYLGDNTSIVGDWITLEPGEPHDIQILAAEMPGGTFSAMLLVEVQDVEYERNRQNGPILPIFKTAEPSLDLIDAIYAGLVPGEACVTNGPVFCDYNVAIRPVDQLAKKADAPTECAPPESVAEEGMRTWIGTDGKTLEARLVMAIGDKAVLEDSRGKKRKIPLSQLSSEDRKFISLADPPEFNIDFSKKSTQRHIAESPDITGNPPKVLDYVFTAKLAQVSAGIYDHELKVEFFAVGEEVNGNNFILLDRQDSRFSPAQENGRFSFSGRTVSLVQTVAYFGRGETRGQKYGGYLVVVTDERGKIIDYGTSNKWLLDILDELRQLPVGRHFDKTGSRVFPPRAKTIFY